MQLILLGISHSVPFMVHIFTDPIYFCLLPGTIVCSKSELSYSDALDRS